MPVLIRETVPALPPVPQSLRERAKASAGTRGMHDAVAADIEALQAVELVQPEAPEAATFPLRVAAWNAERLKFHAPSRALLERAAADVMLLTEIDIGMARSGNVHTLAKSLPAGSGWAIATEFVELGLGDDREKALHAGQRNTAGIHGNAIASRWPIAEVAAIGLDDGALWFTGAQEERRIGGRMAMAAAIDVAGTRIWFASIHLESESSPALREVQMLRVLAALDELAGDGPAIIGGDLNTKSHTAGAVSFDEVARTEPLFARIEAAGFSWREANTEAPTQRARPDGHPAPPHRRLDWLAGRGVSASAPATLAATDADGVAISDHELVAATFAPVEA